VDVDVGFADRPLHLPCPAFVVETGEPLERRPQASRAVLPGELFDVPRDDDERQFLRVRGRIASDPERCLVECLDNV
jgi:hypothetical protein